MSCTEELLASLITNRDRGAYYNASDINRISAVINCLSGEMLTMGYAAAANLADDWTMDDIFYNSNAKQIMDALKRLKSQLASNKFSFIVPNNMNGLNYVQANEIEKMLALVSELIEAIQSAYLQCGVEQAGGVLI